MKVFISIGVLCLLFSCSTIKKQKLYSGLAGSLLMGIIGSEVGKSLSPDPESNRLNQMIGLGVAVPLGFIAGSYIGEVFWDEDQKVNHPKKMILDDEAQRTEEINRTKVKILAPKDVKKIKLESDIPKFLKGKIKEANVLTYEIEEYEEDTLDGRKIYHAPHRAYEYVLE